MYSRGMANVKTMGVSVIFGFHPPLLDEPKLVEHNSIFLSENC